MVTWWKSAVNFAFLSLLAAWRTRSSALGALVRPCVRCAFCCPVLPLASPRPSTTSAAGALALFGGFVGIMGLSDFRWSFIFGFGLVPFPLRPEVLHASGDHRLSRFSRIEVPRMRGVLPTAQSQPGA